jgi:hypothetical protein
MFYFAPAMYITNPTQKTRIITGNKNSASAMLRLCFAMLIPLTPRPQTKTGFRPYFKDLHQWVNQSNALFHQGKIHVRLSSLSHIELGKDAFARNRHSFLKALFHPQAKFAIFKIWVAMSSAELYVQVFLAQVNLVCKQAFSKVSASDWFAANGTVVQVPVS